MPVDRLSGACVFTRPVPVVLFLGAPLEGYLYGPQSGIGMEGHRRCKWRQSRPQLAQRERRVGDTGRA